MYQYTVESCEEMFLNILQRDAVAETYKADVKQNYRVVCSSCSAVYKTQATIYVHTKDCTHTEITEEELDRKLPNQKREVHKTNKFLPQRYSYQDCTS
jgi:hypothetical protein